MAENETKNNNISNSYWDYALEHSGLFQETPMEENRYARIDSSCKLCNKKINDCIDLNNKP